MTSIEDYGFVDFKINHEDYCEYTLDDGTIVRTRAVLLKATKDGFNFKLNERSFGAAFSPKEMRGPPSETKVTLEEIEKLKNSVVKQDIDIIISKERWNEYEFSNGGKIYNKAVLVKASMTDKFDDTGEPIYLLHLQILHKFNLMEKSMSL